MNVEEFEHRLAETVAWCEREMLSSDLRTKTLGSVFFQKLDSLNDVTGLSRIIEETAHVKGAILRHFNPDCMGRWPDKNCASRLQNSELEQEVEQVCQKRSIALGENKYS